MTISPQNAAARSRLGHDQPVRVEPRTVGEPVESAWLDLALKVLAEPTAPFHEQNVMRFVVEYAKHLGLPVYADRVGNLIIKYTPGSQARLSDVAPLVLSAHMDHPGFWALGMAGPRRLRAQWIGRVPEPCFDGAEVRFFVGGRTPIAGDGSGLASLSEHHALGGEPVSGRVLEIESHNPEGDVSVVLLEVDAEVQPGSIGRWALPGPEVIGERLLAPAIDDVAGVAAMLCLLSELVRTRAQSPVTCLFTRAEEAGFIGCTAYCRDTLERQEFTGDPMPCVIGLEMSMAMPQTPVGAGPVVRVGDRRLVFDAGITADCIAAAESLRENDPSFAFQRALMDGGTCESSVFQAMLGRAGAVCLAMDHYHNVDAADHTLTRESIDIQDFVRLVRLLLAIVERHGTQTPSLTRFTSWCDNWVARHEHLFADALATPREAL